MAKNRTRTALRPTVISLAVASCFTTSAALANPTGANVVRGTAAIHQAGNLLQITNSPNAIINWQSFSIGANEITRFLQQSPSSAVLNRVTTQNPSEILGSLQSKLLDGVTTGGRVFLINPNGILFGAGAQIDVGGLVASTLRMSDEDFLAGKMRFGDGLGKSVVNDGSIATAAGGSVYLIGSGVTNNGIIRSPQGEVVLAAGSSVELVSPGTPNLRVEIAATDNEARNLGQIISDAGRIGIYAGLINNSGSIRADSAVSEGGRILLKASKSATLEDSSVLSVQGKGGGEIKVLGGDSVHVAGRLDASAPNGGDGGFIETSAQKVAIDPSVAISAVTPYGKTGTWLIDPNDFHIGLAGTDDITGAALSLILNTSASVTFTSDGRNLGSGNIFVDDAISWASANSLTLIARNDVNVNQAITNTGTGGINLYSGWNGADPLNPTVSTFIGSINLAAPISTAGTAVLVGGLQITQTAAGAISASQLLANAGFGGVHLNTAINSVGVLAGNTFGAFSFTNSPSLTVASVDSGNSNIGIVSGVTSSQSNQVSISVLNGSLTVNNNIIAGGGNSHQASLFLSARDNIVAGRATIRAQGHAGEGPGDTSLTMVAQTGDILLTDTTVESIVLSGCCGTSRNATLNMSAGGNIDLNTVSVTVTGGDNSFNNGAPGGAASATMSAGGSLAMTGTTTAVTGGNGGQGSVNGGNGGNASLVLNGGSISILSSTLLATGGSGGFGGSGGQIQPPGKGGNGGSAMISLNGGPISVTGGSTISAAGGSGASGGFGNIAGAGGNGGAAMVAFTGSSITIDGGSAVNAVGGSGGFGGSGTASGGNGGIGGDAMVALTGSSVSITGSTLTVGGGGGGTGGTGSGSGGVAGVGGAGGDATLSVSGGSMSVAGSTLIVSGGGGGDGGFAFEGGTGGNGGAGGNAAASLGSGSIVLSGGTIAVNAGSGGDGGSASSGGRGGNGNAGGSASVALTGSSIAITGGNMFASGGRGGRGGNGGSGSSAGFGGNGGNGGGASVMLSAGSITVNSGFISANGGSAGSAGFGNSGTGVQGAGGSASVIVAANAGNVFTQFSVISADGAEGGTSVINLVAPGDITVISTTIQAGQTCCMSSPDGGAAAIGLAAGGNITVDGGEGLFARGGPGFVNGGAAAITVVAGGGIAVTNQASINATGGSGNSGTGGAGAITLSANGGSIMVLNTPFSIRAQGGFSNVTGGSAAIAMTALNGMTFDNSTVEATGYPFSGPQNGGSAVVSLNPMGGTINLMNGAVVGAVGGTGTVTSGTGLIKLFFSGRTVGGYFNDGVESLLVNDPLSPTTGFFVNGLPAILNTNILITYSGEVAFVDPLVASMNQQADVLADQLKAGDTGPSEDKEKKKLPFCSG